MTAAQQLFQRAVTLHEAGDTAEAEQLYRKILAENPASFAPLHLLGIIYAQQGRNAEALTLIGDALKINPDAAEALSNYANVLKALGRFDEALAGYDRALAIRPQDAVMLNNRGLVLQQLGRSREALAGYDKALAIRPDYVAALYHRGNVLRDMGRFADALASYDGALLRKPDFAAALNNRGVVLQHLDRPGESVASFRQALALRPDDAEALDNLGCALVAAGDPLAGIDAFRRAVSLQPDFADAHLHLGSTLADNGDIAEGFAHYMRHAELAHAAGRSPRGASAHLAAHDREQRDFLAGGAAAEGAPDIADMFHIADGARIAGPAINPANATSDTMQRWQTGSPRMLVLDNFLTPAALEKLRAYCWGSTVWRRSYEDGYISAIPQDGFACPLLAQIAEEIRTFFSPIIGAHLFHYLSAFKYDSDLRSGTKIHADSAVLNVNFYITPDEANLDPASGGLTVWDASPPADWSFAKYNGDFAANRDYLARRGARATTVPYRANRAVIFDSALLHETDHFAFRPGYLNRRMNVTLLYGRR